MRNYSKENLKNNIQKNKINKKSFTKLKVILISLLLVISITMGGFYIYTLDYYRAESVVAKMLRDKGSKIKNFGNIMAFYPENANDSSVGFIFYPGGKVDADSYAPLLLRLSENGIFCVNIKMPFNLAVFNINGAERVFDKFPNIKEWYIGGHSLGGAMASSYASYNSDKIKGLILLGAYPVNETDIKTLTIYGSEDKVLNKSKLNTNKFSKINSRIEIKGANHAYFGNYGEQKGDGIATLSREQQQLITSEEIVKFIFK